MTENKRFDLTFNQNDQWDIIDKLESEQKNAICIYNDLGQVSFSSAPQVCELLNELHNENQEVFDSIDNRLRYYQEFLENEKRNGRESMLLQRIVDDLKDLKRIKKR